ncbi:EamA family transporter [Modestobacter marinus]|uniref:Membrane protein n=1 Tax=Modestobacter marinus TaxID=477641 RepID=A0ABQ2FWW4_9ACTN|nr:membrane protein [Modestobacter marinus]
MTGRTLQPAPSARGFVLVVLAALCWGTSGITGDLVADRTDLDPLDVAWHRMAVGAAALLTVHLLGRRRAARSPAPPVAWSGPLRRRLAGVGAGLAVYQSAYFAAVATAGVSIATLVALGLAPLLVAVGAAALGHGRPDRATTAALVVALAGLVLLVGVSAGGDGGDAVVLGALAAVGCAAAYAAVVLLSAGAPAGVPTTTVGFTVGAVLLTPVALTAGLDLTTDPLGLALLLYLGLVPTALAYGLFFTGVRAVPAAVASIVTLLEPLTATALAAVVLGERLTPTALVGGALMLGAVTALYLRRMGDSNSRGLAPNPLSKRAP